jgi:polyisoprenoid-binding protein YceI
MIARRLGRTAAALVLLVAGPAGAEPPVWTVDPAKSRLAFTARQGGQAIEGAFTRWTARIRFDPADLAGSSVEVLVDLTSVLTGDPNRDKQAQAAEFFDTARFPEARYRTLAFEAKGDDLFEVVAELSLKGVTRALRHPARIRIDGARATASGEVSLHRRDFGFGSGVFDSEQILGPEILVRFVVEARRS